MSVSESIVTITEDETENNAESKENNITDACGQFNGRIEIIRNEADQNKTNDINIPLYIIPRDEKENLNATYKGEFIVAYNYQPEYGTPQPKMPRIPRFGQTSEEMGPPLEYDPATRNDFVKLVLSLVLLLLVITAAFLIMVLMTPEIKEFFHVTGIIFLCLGLAVLLGVDYAFQCSQCTRHPPCNIICMVLGVIAMCLVSASVTARYETEIVLQAVLATAAVVLVCVLLAYSKFDFTSWLLYVIAIAAAFCMLSMIVVLTMMITGHRIKVLLLVILIVSVLLQVIVLVIELQAVLGGRKVELSENEYAYGAYMLYTSIVSIFLDMVLILGLVNTD